VDIAVALASEIGPGFSPDIKASQNLGFSPRDMLSVVWQYQVRDVQPSLWTGSDMDDLIQSIPGANEFITWFGRWPSFHDAEVLRIWLDRRGLSILEIHVFNMTNAVDATGHCICEKHATLRLFMTEITGCELVDFNHQNVLQHLDISRTDDGYELALASIYGLGGRIAAKTCTIEFESGIRRAASTQTASQPVLRWPADSS
jgi:hypothetical protein